MKKSLSKIPRLLVHTDVNGPCFSARIVAQNAAQYRDIFSHKYRNHNHDNPTNLCFEWGGTVKLDQVDDLLQDQIFLRKRGRNRDNATDKIADILVDMVPAARHDMRILNLQSGFACHKASDGLEYPIQDHCEIYDVTHHALDILLAGMRETEPLAIASACPLTFLDIHYPPNPRTCLGICSSQDYRQINSHLHL